MDQYIEDLRKQGIRAFEWEIYLPERGKLHRACVGSFMTFMHAQLFAKDLRQKGFEASVAKFPGVRNQSQLN
jgi:hypothetical protein